MSDADAIRRAPGGPAPGRGRSAGAALCAAALLLLSLPAGADALSPGALAPERQAAAGAVADSSELDARTARVADQLRCPVCRSQSVLESSSTLAREMKAEIRRRLAEGQTPEQVKAYFVSRYGDWILLRPVAEGLNLVVYVLPPLLLVGGGLLVWALLRRWNPRVTARSGSDGRVPTASPPVNHNAAPGDGLSEDEERRLEEALRERS